MSNLSNDLENLRLVSTDITLHAHLQTSFLAKQIKRLNCSASDISTFFQKKKKRNQEEPSSPCVHFESSIWCDHKYPWWFKREIFWKN